MTKKILVALLKFFIKEAQKSIGLVSYKLPQSENGGYLLGDLMKQPWTFEIYFDNGYIFDKRRKNGKHVVISSTDFTVIEYSSDPRESTMRSIFTSPTDVARHCASTQIQEATYMSLSRDTQYAPINSKASVEQLMKYTELIQRHKLLVKECLERYLTSRKAKFISSIIKTLSSSALIHNNLGKVPSKRYTLKDILFILLIILVTAITINVIQLLIR